MQRPEQAVAIEAGRGALATAALMTGIGLAVLAVTIARGLAWTAAVHAYLRGALFFVPAWWILMAIFYAGYVLWRRLRRKPKPEIRELPPELASLGVLDTARSSARRELPFVGFLLVLALVVPRFAAVLAGFSLIGVGLVPIWIYRLRRPALYLVRGPGRRQTTWYSGRSPE